MNTIYKILLGIFSAALIISLSGSLYYYNKINHIYQEEVTYVFDDDAVYHFSLIIGDNGDIYWQNFKEGAYEAAKANDAAIEMNIVSGLDPTDKIIEYLDIAGRSKVDGVIVLGENSVAQDEAINNLVERGIRVIVVGQESIDTNISSFVGTNSYEYGARAARFIKEMVNDVEQINVAVILSANYANREKSTASQGDIMMNSMKNIIEKQSNMSLIVTRNSESELLGAEETVREILNEYSQVNAIFCTSANDTEAAARIVVEKNLVGKVKIIGTGVTASIISYIEKGVVLGTIDKNGYQAGLSSVELLCNQNEDILQPDYIDIDMDFYTSINIGSYPLK
ncbi:MAG: substrate-binding domain-containing protein [Eubacteriales bacterium]